ncbi:MAG: DNA repair protein RecO [Armatimonadetes bacterium]|nr:DNA repair protein RecO [Armatimonadota bacterium]
MSRVYHVQAVVMRRRNLAETDKIVTLFTRERGKLSAVAKGARRPQSRIAGATEPPTFVRAFMAVGQNLDLVTQCEVKEAFPHLRTDYDRLTYCNYLLELADTLLEERLPQPELFDLLLSALYLLNGGADPLPLVTAFSLQAAEDAGFGPSLDERVRCHEPISRGLGGYSVGLGGALCRVCRPSVKDAIRFPVSALDTAKQLLELDLPAVAKLTWPEREVRGLLRILRRHTEYRTEKKLKSAEFLEALQLKEKSATDTADEV